MAFKNKIKQDYILPVCYTKKKKDPEDSTWADRKFTYWSDRSGVSSVIMHDKHTLTRVRSAY